MRMSIRVCLNKMSAWQKRLLRDIEELRVNNFEVVPDEGTDLQLACFRVVLNGPKETPYEGGKWHVRFTFTTNFPFSSPSVGIIEHIMHPNIDWASGSVCLDALNKKWSPVFTLRHIMETLLPYLLAYPNPDDPLNREAAILLRESPTSYSIRVTEATQRYAMKSAVVTAP
jgi:ubiquitin-conjugating enzyme E2 H